MFTATAILRKDHGHRRKTRLKEERRESMVLQPTSEAEKDEIFGFQRGECGVSSGGGGGVSLALLTTVLCKEFYRNSRGFSWPFAARTRES